MPWCHGWWQILEVLPSVLLAALSTIVGFGILVAIIVNLATAVLIAHGMRFWDKLLPVCDAYYDCRKYNYQA